MQSNNDINNEELRRRFNPDGSALRDLQMRMLEMLKVFDGICQKHDIRYWLSSGTLIGCVRHGGFIPWDDDLDVEMLREDYLRLKAVLLQELPDWLALQCRETDPHYFFSYPKLRDVKSELKETNNYDRIFRYKGIFIDIFVLEKSPSWLHKLSCTTLGHVYKILKNKSLSEETIVRRVDALYGLNHKVIYPVMRQMSKLHRSRNVHHTFGTPYPAPRCLDDIFPLKRMMYEGVSMPVPNNADAYLRKMYGDYMKLPNIDEIKMHFK